MKATASTLLARILLVALLAALGSCRAIDVPTSTVETPPTAGTTAGGVPGAVGAPAPGTGTPGATTPATRALDQLALLTVRGRAPMTGYDRDLFGQAWADTDRNGCDTRNDVLRRDLDDVVIKPNTYGCVVLTGTLVDPYSGEVIEFVRGQSTSAEVQIDHVVALADAWQSGAQGWSPELRTAFANDPLNLLAVDGELNQRKGASNAASWLPPDRSAWCGFASQQIAVKVAYGLSVTPSEREALRRAALRCSEDTLLAPAGPVPLGPRPDP